MANDPEPSARVIDVLADMLDRPPGERDAFLAAACGDDASLRAEVRSLAGRDGAARSFLETPAVASPDTGALDPGQGKLEAGCVLGDCKILRLIGEGGMGEVYLADDTKLGRQVAVKLLKRSLHDGLGRHFQHERRVLAGLTHPGIARLYSAAISQDRAYFVMEYVEGERLDEYCHKRRLSIDERLTLFRKVCAAVAYAHQNLVVHRDLKPANIRVTAEGEPKLLDFGIAKLLDPEATRDAEQTVTMLGAMTPRYASPEQLRGEPITTATDIYSLGVVLYELLSGQRPYRVTSQRPDELARAICEQEPTRLSVAARREAASDDTESFGGEPAHRLRRRLAGDLETIVAMAIRKDPARRYASAAQFSEDLRRHCEGLPVLARADTLRYRAGKFVRRNKLAVTASALLLCALLGGMATTIWQAHAARQAQTRAELAQARAERAQAQAEHLNGFLQTLLGSADPENGPGPDLKVIQVLDQASARLDTELAGDPALLAQAHQTMGEAYAGLRAAEPAIRHLRAAVELSRQAHGDDDLVTAHAKAALGIALSVLARQQTEAEPYLREALAVERRYPQTGQRERALTLEHEGRLLADAHHDREAQVMATESLALTRQIYGERSLPYAKSLVQLAHLVAQTGDYAGTEIYLRQSVAICRQLGVNTPSFATELTTLGYVLILQGKLDEPEAILLEAQDRYRATVGEKSIAFCLNLGTLGWLHFLRGDYPAAERELRQSQEYARPLVPPGDQDLVGGAVTLATALLREGKAAEAEPLLRESLVQARLNHLIGTAQPATIEATLGECLQALGRFAEAEDLFTTSYNEVKASCGERDARTLAAAHRLHDFYLAWHKPTEASRFP